MVKTGKEERKMVGGLIVHYHTRTVTLTPQHKPNLKFPSADTHTELHTDNLGIHLEGLALAVFSIYLLEVFLFAEGKADGGLKNSRTNRKRGGWEHWRSRSQREANA